MTITVAPGRGGGGPHPGLTGARPSPPPPSPAPPRGLTRDAPSRGGSSLPATPGHPTHGAYGRATRTHAAPYAYRAPPARATPRHHPHTAEARESGLCGTTPHTEQYYKSTKRVRPHSTLHRQSALLQRHKVSNIYRGGRKKARLGETDRITLPGPGIAARQPGQRLARGPPCRRPHR